MSSAMNRVRGRGGSNGSAASCKHESHEALSHASSTTEIKLVVHPVDEPSPQKWRQLTRIPRSGRAKPAIRLRGRVQGGLRQETWRRAQGFPSTIPRAGHPTDQ